MARNSAETPTADAKAIGRRLREFLKSPRVEPDEARRAGGGDSDPRVGLRGRASPASRRPGPAVRQGPARHSRRAARPEAVQGERLPEATARFIRRFQDIDKLSRSEKQTLLKTIDHFLRGAQVGRS